MLRVVLTFIETKLFTSLIPQYLTDDEYSALQQELAKRPDSGQVFPAPAECASFAGVRKAAANEAESELSTTCA
jgi:hypothetical protein